MNIIYSAVGGGVGDGVLQFPVLTAVRRSNPGCSITWAGRWDVGQLAQSFGIVDFSRPQAGQKYDLAMAGPMLDPRGEYLPKQALGKLGLAIAVDFGLQTYRAPTPNTLALLTGASVDAKLWARDKWLELVKALPESWRLVIPCDRDNLALGKAMAAAAPSRATVLTGTLTEVSAAIGRCSNYIGTESGLSHLAAAIGLPGVILWALNGYDAYKPPGTVILTTRATTDQALEALR